MVPEALGAAGYLSREGIFANVFSVTSAGLLYRDLRAAVREGRPSRLGMIVGEADRDNPVVSVVDGHSHALAFLGSALGAEQVCLGSDDFGQSGLPE